MDSDHSSGCFPCGLFQRLVGRTERPKQHPNLPPPYAVNDTEATFSKSEEKTEDPLNQDSDTPQSGPSIGQYALEATKKTIQLFKSVAELAGVPLVTQVFDLGLGIIDLFEQFNEVQSRVQDLQKRIAEFLVVIAQFMLPDNHTNADECANVLKTMSDDLVNDLDDLRSCLNFITQRLQHIKDQNLALTTLLPDCNMTEIEQWEKAFQDAVDRFQTLRGLRASQDLTKIQADLQQIHETLLSQLDGMKKQLNSLELKLDSCVEELRARLTSDNEQQAIPKIPKVPSHFYGRDVVVDKIAKIVCSPEEEGSFSRVCILGPGGLGKSSTAFAVMRHKDVKAMFKERQFFVLCTSATSPSALLGALAQSVGIPFQSNDVLDAVITKLSASSDPCLMLLDNFETPWQNQASQPSQTMTVYEILERLDSLPHLAILLTMRSGPDCTPLPEWKCENLAAVDPGAARQIYIAIDASAKESLDLDNLLGALDYMPYAISLMATLGRRSVSSPTKLLQEWHSRGTDLIKQGMDRAIGLSVKSPFVIACPGAVELLQGLSMLPAGTPRSHLELWFDSCPSEAVATLHEAALLNVGLGDDPQLFVLPVVQSYMQKDIPPGLRRQVYNACLRILRNNDAPIKGPNDTARFKEHVGFLKTEERNIEALLTEILINPSAPTAALSTDAMRAFQTFIWYQFWTQPRLHLAEKVVGAADVAKDAQGKAEALFCFGKLLCKIDRYADAYNILHQAHELFLTLNNPTSQRFAVLCELEQVDALSWSHPGSQTGQASLEALAASCQEDDYLEALRLKNIGVLLWQKGDDIHTALDCFAASRIFFDQCSSLYESTSCSYYAAKALASLGQHRQAVNELDRAIDSFKVMGIMGDEIAVFSLVFKVRCLKMLKQPVEEVLETLSVALELSRHTGRPLALAQTLEEYGEVYVLKKDWPAATLAYEEAQKAVSRVDDSSPLARQLIPDRCANNLRYIQNHQREDQVGDISFVPPPRR